MSSQSAILLLAAGASSRWGHPKALIPWKGDYLINRLAEVALATGAELVVRVLGSRASLISVITAPPGLVDTFNPGWRAGMGNSIACGLRKVLERSPEIKGIVVLPCDLPLVTAEHLCHCLSLVEDDPHAIVQSDYENGTLGPPVAFGRAYFPKLLLLDSDEGGRSVIKQHTEHLTTISFPDAQWDLDSSKELEELGIHLSQNKTT